MSEAPRGRENIVLAVVGLLLGVGAAAGYAAWRAVSDGDSAAFADAMLFPGSLIIVTVTVMVWLGWKANIDD